MKTPLLLSSSLAAAVLASSAFAQVPEFSPNAAVIPSDSPAITDLQPPTLTSTIATPSPAATASAPKTSGAPSAAEMQQMMAKMMELGKPGENHKQLAQLVGNWTYTVKMWMDPSAPPTQSKGTATRKAVMDGRFFIADAKGSFKMPGPDGKMKDFDFTGMAIEGYDNVKKKFVSTWIDNMGTMIMVSEGSYDAASKTFTYQSECEMMPGMRVKIRELVKVADADHHTFEWYEDRGAGEAKTMEISYTRKK